MGTVAIDITTEEKGGETGMVTIDATAIAGMVDNALAFCAEKTGFPDGQALEAIQNGDCLVCGYLRYGLSKEIGAYLGSIDSSVRAVYTYEPEYSVGPDDVHRALDRGISLIVAVGRRSAALSSVIASLEDGLEEARQRLICSKANGSCHALDVKVVDEQEVASRRGYGALISSLHVRPLLVWPREE